MPDVASGESNAARGLGWAIGPQRQRLVRLCQVAPHALERPPQALVQRVACMPSPTKRDQAPLQTTREVELGPFQPGAAAQQVGDGVSIHGTSLETASSRIVHGAQQRAYRVISGAQERAEDFARNNTVSTREPMLRRASQSPLSAVGEVYGNSDVPPRSLIDTAFALYIPFVKIWVDGGNDMQRYALAPLKPMRERVLVAVPGRATHWTIAQRNQGVHRLLVPVDASLRGIDALRYIGEHLGDSVADVHVVNVQRPIMSGNITPLVTVGMVAESRQAAGERVLALARKAFEGSVIPMTTEVAFGDAAETICRIAERRGRTGIVIGRDGFDLHDLIRGSVAARILRLASVPVTIVTSRAAAAIAQELRRSESSGFVPLLAQRIDQAETLFPSSERSESRSAGVD
jgi:nucleotide-binding universal stress UspA family protein